MILNGLKIKKKIQTISHHLFEASYYTLCEPWNPDPNRLKKSKKNPDQRETKEDPQPWSELCSPWDRTELEFLKQSVEARNRVGIRLSYRPARLHRLAELFLGIDSWAP
jgi:hypothetical protein